MRGRFSRYSRGAKDDISDAGVIGGLDSSSELLAASEEDEELRS
jgi:hypothetical protein